MVFEQKLNLVGWIAILPIQDEDMDVNRLLYICSLLDTLTVNQEWSKGAVVFRLSGDNWDSRVDWYAPSYVRSYSIEKINTHE